MVDWPLVVNIDRGGRRLRHRTGESRGGLPAGEFPRNEKRFSLSFCRDTPVVNGIAVVKCKTTLSFSENRRNDECNVVNNISFG